MTNDGPFKPTPEDAASPEEQILGISKYAPIALSIIDVAQRGMKPILKLDNALSTQDINFFRHNNISLNIDYPFSPILNFGELDDPKTPCGITLLAISQDAGAGYRIPLLFGKQIIFGKSIALALLSKVKPGETATIEGKGKYHVYSKTYTSDQEVQTDRRVNFVRNTPVGLSLELELTTDSKKVIFCFSTREKDQISIARELTFEKKGILTISGIPKLVSSIGRFGRSRE